MFSFVDAVLEPEVREHYVHLPSAEEMRLNMGSVWEKYRIPNTIGGIDGCHFSFWGQPRSVVFILNMT